MHIFLILKLCDWFSSSSSACDSDDPVFVNDRVRKWNQKNQNTVFTGS